MYKMELSKILSKKIFLVGAAVLILISSIFFTMATFRDVPIYKSIERTDNDGNTVNGYDYDNPVTSCNYESVKLIKYEYSKYVERELTDDLISEMYQNYYPHP